MSLNVGARFGERDPQIAIFEANLEQHRPIDGTILPPAPPARPRKKRRVQPGVGGGAELKLDTRSGKDIIALQKYIGPSTRGKIEKGTWDTYKYKVLVVRTG